MSAAAMAMVAPVLVTGAHRPSQRVQVEAAIEWLIDLLDAMDGDADLEPSISPDEREDQCEDEGVDTDREASLCGVTFGTNGSEDREPDFTVGDDFAGAAR